MKNRTKNGYIQILKVLGCILILNSHCPYPETLWKIGNATSIFQIGGGWGNTIFFCTSGYLIGGSCDRPFVNWIVKRYVRVVPITCIMAIISYFQISQEMGLVRFITTAYWFCTAIVIYYPFFYIIDRCKKGYAWGFLIWAMLYILIYLKSDFHSFFIEAPGFDFFKIFMFFSVMLVGGYLKRVQARIINLSVVFLGLLIVLSGIIWALIYGAMTVFHIGFEIQFLVTVSRVLFGFAAISLAVVLNNRQQFVLKRNNFLDLIGDSTLEIYLVQNPIKLFIGSVLFLVFPYNTVVFWLFSLGVGMILHYLCEKANEVGRIIIAL